MFNKYGTQLHTKVPISDKDYIRIILPQGGFLEVDSPPPSEEPAPKPKPKKVVVKPAAKPAAPKPKPAPKKAANDWFNQLNLMDLNLEDDMLDAYTGHIHDKVGYPFQ